MKLLEVEGGMCASMPHICGATCGYRVVCMHVYVKVPQNNV